MTSLRDVFIDDVKDLLDGTPHAHHPVQFERIETDHFVACTLCGAAVPSHLRWQELHRKNHDDHNKVHADIDAQSRRYVPEPRYG